MRLFFIILSVAGAVGIAAVALAATPAVPDLTPVQIIAKQKKTIESLRDQRADMRQERDAQDAVIEDLQASNARLRARLAAVPDPLDAITARSPDGLWAAVQAIWAVFPAGPTGLCGYDKSITQNDGLTPAILSFYKYTIC
jgi:hypothetical protein